MALDKALEKLKFDKRMQDWNFKTGVLSKEELASHLSGLEDVERLAVKLDLQSSDQDDQWQSEPPTMN